MLVTTHPSDTPLLLLAWRRPHTLRQVIDAIRPLRPRFLYVACDGPNPQRPGEHEKVAATRHLIDQAIDWPCRIEKLYSDINQGCRLGVSRAISWFFENEEEGIILEDDCVPLPEFLPFCTTLLERYRHDSRVASIGGHNPVTTISRTTDLVFTRYFECWGWATWRRAWKLYDDNMKILGLHEQQSRMNSLFSTPEEVEHWKRKAHQLIETDSPSSWAYRFQLCSQAHNTVHAISLQSLVVNVGFDSDGTHCAETLGIESQPGNQASRRNPRKGINHDFSSEPTTLPDREFDFAYAALHGIQFRRPLMERMEKKVRQFLTVMT
jgi:hypothetical protein